MKLQILSLCLGSFLCGALLMLHMDMGDMNQCHEDLRKAEQAAEMWEMVSKSLVEKMFPGISEE